MEEDWNRKRELETTRRNQMGRVFAYVILGGSVAVGYAALEFVCRRSDGAVGELYIISDETVCLPSTLYHFLFN